MKRIQLVACICVLTTSLGAEPVSLFPDQAAAWKQAGPGEFKVEENIATASGGMGLWWFSEQVFADATFSLEFKLNDPAYNSGVFVRFPDPGDDPWVAVKKGFEIQISGSEPSVETTGAIYNLQAPVEIPLVPADEWNTMVIHTLRNNIYVFLNGKLTNFFAMEKGQGARKGYFGIQNHDDNSPVQFRNITVTEHHNGGWGVVENADLVSYRAKKNPNDFWKKDKKWYDQADFGPAFIQTWGDFVEKDYRPNAALKGLLYRMDPEQPDLVALFNMETLQWITATEEGVSLDNTPWGGAHGSQNKINNFASSYFTHPLQPAWPDKNGSTEDRRPVPGHGNYEHLQFQGYYRQGRKVILDLLVNGEQLYQTFDKNAEGSYGPVEVTEKSFLKGGPAIFHQTFPVTPKLDNGKTPFLVDQIPLPPIQKESPWGINVRLTDLHFFPDGDQAALCTWDGDVWLLSGLKEFEELTWKRFASGLFEPLGLQVVEGVIHVCCRDGIWQLIDLNDDQEADHYRVFWNDLLITENFHEFVFGLERDEEGNFYFTKASPVRAGGRNFDKIVPHNGVIIKVSPDGSSHQVMATGLRAPGGIGVGPNGVLTTGENEGTWIPACKVNYFTQKQAPVFLGVEATRHEVTTPYHKPLCYLPMTVDNSGGQQVWIPKKSSLGLAEGTMLHLSYGQSSIYQVLPQELPSGQMQGGVVKLPIRLSSSAQRADFHPDGSMYVVGMRGWQTNAAQEAGLQRVRRNPEALLSLPVNMKVEGELLTLSFDSPLDRELAEDLESFSIQRWNYVYGPQYGSGHFSVDEPDADARERAMKAESKNHRKQDQVEVSKVILSEDGQTLTLTIPSLKPADQMQIDYDLETTEGEILINTIYATVHQN